MIGDATLFQRADNIEAGWAAVQPILDPWATTLRRISELCRRQQRPGRGRRVAGARRPRLAAFGPNE